VTCVPKIKVSGQKQYNIFHYFSAKESLYLQFVREFILSLQKKGTGVLVHAMKVEEGGIFPLIFNLGINQR
jgi:hypothetical protein